MIGISACSNPIHSFLRNSLSGILDVTSAAGYVFDARIEEMYAHTTSQHQASGRIWRTDPRDRAQLVNDLFADPQIDAIFDFSGGDLANEVLPYLDWDVIAAHPKPFAGYSDLSTIVNAINVRTGQATILWDPRAISQRGVGDIDAILSGEVIRPTATHPDGVFLPDGPIYGGNLRCWPKLVATEYWTNREPGHLLLIEALGLGLETAISYVTLIRDTGYLDGCAGIIMGQFTKIDADGDRDTLTDVVREVTGLDVWHAHEFGHSGSCEPVTVGRADR